MFPVRVVIVGAGGRGRGYATYAQKHPDRMKVVAVAEPREWYRQDLAGTYGIPPANVLSDWRQLARRPKLADAAFICTQDHMHVGPAVALAKKGYHLLLEKPMAPTAAGCRKIVKAATDAGILFAVCHVLRYTAYTQRLKALLDSGAIGDVVSIQHLEPVGYWHQAHSFVRGNWRNEKESSFMLLAKSCHDLDWIRYVMGAPCRSVASFGSLYHFRREQAPAGAGQRCLDCPVEQACPYSAKKIYLGRLAQGHRGWPLLALTPQPSVETITEALRSGPYGRCVYQCDNDVVDNQVVSMEFAGGRTAVFTMTAFNRAADRKTRIFGTRGEIYGDGKTIEHFDFLTDHTDVIDTSVEDADNASGHGGGDYHLIRCFIEAVGNNDRSNILSGPMETLESHLMIFAAEKARRAGKVLKMGDVAAEMGG